MLPLLTGEPMEVDRRRARGRKNRPASRTPAKRSRHNQAQMNGASVPRKSHPLVAQGISNVLMLPGTGFGYKDARGGHP